MNSTVIAYRPELAHELGPVGALIVQQLSYWESRTTGHGEETKGWVWKSYTEWATELGAGIKQIRNALTKLVDMGIVIRDRLKAKQWWQVYWYKLDWDRLKTLFPSICPQGQMDDAHRANRSAPKGKSSYDPKTTNKDLSSRQPERALKKEENSPLEKDFLEWVIKEKISRLPNRPVCPDLAAVALINRSPSLRADWEASKPRQVVRSPERIAHLREMGWDV